MTSDYALFWTSLLFSLFREFLILVFVSVWIGTALMAIGGMRERNWKRILSAFLFGSLALGNVLKNIG